MRIEDKKFIVKLIAGLFIILLAKLGSFVSMFFLGSSGIETNIVLVTMSWQIWDNVIVPTIEKRRPQITSSEDGFFSLKFIE